ncbi:MAG: hypothetical protein LJE68_08570 [Rhodobacter sp.]|nr:hypothetical protein [Rhodobacter sp.]
MDSVEMRANRIASLIEERLGVRGQGLEAKLRRAGRLLPRWVRREAAQLAQAERLLGHPKLMMQTDPGALEKAYKHCESWLEQIDPAARRKERILGLLGVSAANLLIVAGLFITYLVWSGHV